MKIKKLSKEDKEKIKKRVKSIEKLDTKSKRLLKFILLFYGYILLTIVLMYFWKDFAFFYITYIINPINGVLFAIMSLIPYGSYVFLMFYFLLIIFFTIYIIVLTNNKKEKVNILNKRYNFVCRIFLIAIAVCLFSVTINDQISHLNIMDEILFKDTIDKTYTIDDMDNLANYYIDKIDEYSKLFERDENNKIINNNDLNKQAISDLKNSSSMLPQLKGLYPLKSYNLNSTLRGIVGSNITGLTMGYTTYFRYDLDPNDVLQTITHEFCHTKGFTKENETVMCSYIAGVNSNNELSNYAAYIEALSRTLAAYSYIDEERESTLEDKFLSKCLKNGYSEICNARNKEYNEYIYGSYELDMLTYHLSNYKDYKEELIESLKLLQSNGFSIKLSITNEEISIDKVSEYIDKGMEKSIYINGNFDEDIFNKIRDAFKNPNLYSQIYQINSEYEDSEELKNDPLKFFLSPFPKDYDNIYNTVNVLSVDYTYERVVRLLLEYHEKYGY